MTIRIVIAEDNKQFREVLRQMITSVGGRYTIVDEATNGVEAIACVENCQPDLLILDLKMPNVDGIEVIQVVRKRWKHIHILVLTMSQSRFMLEKAMESGANGYCTKTSKRAEILKAVELAARGDLYISPDMDDAY